MLEVTNSTFDWPQSIVELDFIARRKNFPGAEIDSLWRTHDMLARLFSGRYRGSGRPFINHLAGTAGLALIHGSDVVEVLASFAHAAYAQGEFGRLKAGASTANRRAVRTVIGASAESLVFDYDSFDWLALLDKQARGEKLDLDDRKRSLLFMKIFNELDDSRDCGVYNPSWCENCLVRLELGAGVAETCRPALHCKTLTAACWRTSQPGAR